jgi:L-seryl-tRNA(Ser) seleniumtransferase
VVVLKVQEENMLTRRGFLSGIGLASVSGSIPVRRTPAGAVDVYKELGVRPFINAAGTYTALSASLMPKEVREAMESAASRYVSIPELQEAAGRRIASLVGAEAALVTSGCAAALTLGTAAAVAGSNQEAILRIPDVTGLKNEVVLPKGHRFVYDHAVRNVGVQLVEAGSPEELRASVNEKTAMLFYLNHAANKSPITREELVDVGKTKGIPTLIDAAADLPPVKNLTAFLQMGFDLVAFSGGKGLRGPQSSGLLLGRRDLIQAAFLNGSPHSDSIGRLAKVGKEEIVGLTRALELYLARDHEADWKEWEARVAHIVSRFERIDGVRAERFVPEIANEVPHAAITWDPKRFGLSRETFAKALRDGEPRIEPRPSANEEPRLEIGVWMMEPDEHRVVADRCVEVLKGSRTAA